MPASETSESCLVQLSQTCVYMHLGTVMIARFGSTPEDTPMWRGAFFVHSAHSRRFSSPFIKFLKFLKFLNFHILFTIVRTPFFRVWKKGLLSAERLILLFRLLIAALQLWRFLGSSTSNLLVLNTLSFNWWHFLNVASLGSTQLHNW